MDGRAVSLVVDAEIGRGDFRRRVALTVAPGEVAGVTGPNGSGKTTLLHTIAGLERVRSGSVSLEGRVLDDGRVFVEPRERRCVVVFQDHRLFPTMSILANVAYGPRSHGAPRAEAEERARAALERVGISGLAGRRPGDVSGGERQRAAIARAIVTNPKVLLLDEPFASVDAASRPGLREMLRGLLGGLDARVVIVTHDPADLASLAGAVTSLD